jgi:hypothetical protein
MPDNSSAAAFDARTEAAFATGATTYGDYVDATGNVVILDATTIAALLNPTPPPAPDPPPPAPPPSPNPPPAPPDSPSGSDDHDGGKTFH